MSASCVAVKKQPPSPAHALRLETEKARALVESIREILQGDEQATQDMVEGSTDLFPAIEAAVARIDQLEMLIDGISARSTELSGRKSRFEQQLEDLRAAICVAMETAKLPKHEGPLATVNLQHTGRQLEVVDESAIPTTYFKTGKPKLDKNKLAADLRAGKVVNGARLDNGGLTIQIRKG